MTDVESEIEPDIIVILTLLLFWICVQESLAFMFEMANLREDALREYDELEQIYSETGEAWLMNVQ